MQKKLNQFTYSIRKSVRNKLQNHSKIHTFLIFLHRKYCSLTGGLHVLPDFYIIGTQKGGTSSLYDYLTEHPSIESCYSKEPSYFDRYYERGLNWYKINFPFKIQKFFMTKIRKKIFLTGEASVRYLDHPFTPERIKKITPNAKFIVLLRNPVSRSFSQYTRVKGNNREQLSFEDAFHNESKRTRDDFEKIFSNPLHYADSYFTYSYFERGIYVDKLKHWMKIFPKEQFLIIQSEIFFKNPSDTLNQVLDFLGLNHCVLNEYKIRGKVNKNKIFDLDFQKQLSDYFKPHNQRLYDFLGKKFDWDE